MSKTRKHEAVRRRLGIYLKVGLIVAGLLFILSIVGLVGIVIQTIFILAFGWIFYLKDVVPDVEIRLGMIASGLLAFAVAVFGFHTVMGKFRTTWLWKWTFAVSVTIALTFASSIAMTGMIHQASWLLRGDVVSYGYGSRKIRNLSNFRSFLIALQAYHLDYDRFPPNLEDLYPDYIDISPEENPLFWNTASVNNQLFGRLYFPEMVHIEDLEANKKPILLAGFADEESVIVGYSDGELEYIESKDFRERISEQARSVVRAIAAKETLRNEHRAGLDK